MTKQLITINVLQHVEMVLSIYKDMIQTIISVYQKINVPLQEIIHKQQKQITVKNVVKNNTSLHKKIHNKHVLITVHKENIILFLQIPLHVFVLKAVYMAVITLPAGLFKMK